MADSDIKLKIKEVIEATILSIVQEQSEKIEKLERLVEQQQDRIQILEEKIFNTDQQKNVRKDSKHHTTNPNIQQQQTTSNTTIKPDSNLIKSQLKKLEIEKDKLSDQKQQSNQKQRASMSIQQTNQNNLQDTKQQLSKQFQRGEPVKALPDPKKMKTQTSEISKPQNQNSQQPSKQSNQINKASSQRDLLSMKKSPSQTIVYATENQIKQASSPKNGQKSQFFSTKQEVFTPQSPGKILTNSKNNQKEQQIESQLKTQLSENLAQESDSIPRDSRQVSQQLEESDTQSQNLEYQLQKIDTQASEISEIEQEDMIELSVDFKQMTNDTFDMIEQNFVNDLIQQQDLPEAANIVVFIFLKIVTEMNTFSYDDEKFWEKALQYLLENEKKFPQFLSQISKRTYKKKHLELINKLITENPDVTDPEKFEEIDALICSLSYFIKDFQRALKKKLI